MIQHITRSTAQTLFDCMGVEVTLPVTPDYDWFAFYGGQEFPLGVVFSHYTSSDDGLMGIIARQHVDIPKRETPKVEERLMTHPTPKPFTITLPKRLCANPACRALLPMTHKFATCCYRCKLAVDAELARVEAADRAEAKEQPF